MENNHHLVLGSSEDIKTLHHFCFMAKKYEEHKCKNKYDEVICKQAYDIIPKIVRVEGNSGYVVLEDNTIRCTPNCSSWIAQYDGCEESEMRSGFNAAIKGY